LNSVNNDGEIYLYTDGTISRFIVKSALETTHCWNVVQCSSVSNESMSRDSSVGIALSYGLDDRVSTVPFPAWAGCSSLHRCVQTRSVAHPASYQMHTGDSFRGGRAGGTWGWSLTSICCRGQECVQLYLHSPNMPSWSVAQLKQGDNFYLYLRLFISNNLYAAKHSSFSLFSQVPMVLSFLTTISPMWYNVNKTRDLQHSLCQLKLSSIVSM